MIRDSLKENRTCRRFYQDVAVERKTLEELVDLTRLSPSTANMQSLKYILSCDPEKNALIFQYLGWAGALKDWAGPSEGEKPSAHIIILGDTEIRKGSTCDHGIAALSIFLGAREKGLGGCMHGSVKREQLSKALNIPSQYEILLVLSIGKPKEEVVLETLEPGVSFNYWRDSDNVHHVPKRRLEEIIIG